ncbi:MAG: PD40 domain-containing protein, partial [Pseudomonadales bacterium]|nr:PD40 domain-containing protein [Pseudomonadales bacterium]
NLVSYTPQQIIANNSSLNPTASRSGTAIVFESDATNLVPYSTTTPYGDGNNARDIFMRVGGRTLSRISVNSLGQEAENSAYNWYDGNNRADSYNASISSDGKLVVFESRADNLDLLTTDANTTGAETDVFIRDIAKKKTYRLSGILDGADGSITPSQLDIFGNPVSSTDAPWKIMTEADDESYDPVVVGTAKSGTVAFMSDASNLIAGFPLTDTNNVYAMSLQTKTLELVNAVHNPITGAPTAEDDGDATGTVALSPDGRFVAFASDGQNLVGGVAYPTGSNNIFIYDRKLFQMYQLSGVATPVGNGYAITTEGNDDSSNPSITGGGKGKNYLIAFQSQATNMDSLVVGPADAANTNDVFVVEFGPVDPKDANSAYEIKPSSVANLPIRRISAQIDAANGLATVPGSRNGGTNTASSDLPTIAGTSTAYTVAFRSSADNLIADTAGLYWNTDTNSTSDIYVFSSKTNTFSRANVDTNGQQGTANASNPSITPDGKGVVFDTSDQYLVPASYLGNGNTQVYLRK